MKYRYLGCHAGIMRWQSTTPIAPNESRHDEIRCGWLWFWTSAGMSVDLTAVPGLDILGVMGEAKPPVDTFPQTWYASHIR